MSLGRRWRTGLHGDADDSTDLGTDEFSYDDFMKREFPSTFERPAGLSWFWWITGLLLLGALAWGFFRF
jgi:hypothetical protein